MFESSVKCKECGWYAKRMLREKVLKGECPHCGAYKGLKPC